MYSALNDAIWTEIVFLGLKRQDRRFHLVRRGDYVREAVVIHVARNRVLICRFASFRTEQICFQLLPKEKRTRNCKKVREAGKNWGELLLLRFDAAPNGCQELPGAT